MSSGRMGDLLKDPKSLKAATEMLSKMDPEAMSSLMSSAGGPTLSAQQVKKMQEMLGGLSSGQMDAVVRVMRTVEAVRSGVSSARRIFLSRQVLVGAFVMLIVGIFLKFFFT